MAVVHLLVLFTSPISPLSNISSFNIYKLSELFRTINVNLSLIIIKSKNYSFLDKIVDKKQKPQTKAVLNDLEREMIKYENHEFTLSEDSEEPDSLLMFFKFNKIAYLQFSTIR